MGTPQPPIPGYWMNEAGGVRRPAVEAYLNNKKMTPEQILAMRAYLRQWIVCDQGPGPMIDVLRTSVEHIETQDDIRRWLRRADLEDIDPL